AERQRAGELADPGARGGREELDPAVDRADPGPRHQRRDNGCDDDDRGRHQAGALAPGPRPDEREAAHQEPTSVCSSARSCGSRTIPFVVSTIFPSAERYTVVGIARTLYGFKGEASTAYAAG